MRDDELNDVRRERIVAATEIFERVLGDVEPASGTRHDSASRPDRVQLAQLRTAAARTVDL